MAENRTEIEKVYRNLSDPGGYGSISAVYQSLKAHGKPISKNQISTYLKGKDSYTLNAFSRRRFPRRKIMVSHPHEQYEGDLADFTRIKRKNGGHTFILIEVDVLSRHVRAIPLKNKSAKSMVFALEKLFSKQACSKYHTDMGQEFTAKPVREIYKKYKIKHFHTQGGTKAALGEIFIRTLRRLLSRYFVENNTTKYIDVLDSIIAAYNNRPHSAHKLTPNEALKPENRARVWKALYGKKCKHAKERFKLGDMVRIQLEKRKFQKESEQQFSNEIFEIYEIMRDKYAPISYKLIDGSQEVLDGLWYPSELIKITRKRTEYKFEKVIKTKRGKLRGSREFLVKFKGIPVNQSRWMNEKELKELKLQQNG